MWAKPCFVFVTYLKVMQHFGTSIVWRLLKQDNSWCLFIYSISWRDPVFNLHGTYVNHWWSMGQSMVLEVYFDLNFLDHQRDLRHGHLWANDLTPKGLVKGKIPAKGKDFGLVNWNYTPRNWNIAPKKKKSRWFIFVFSHTHTQRHVRGYVYTHIFVSYLYLGCPRSWLCLKLSFVLAIN